ncbi:bis(5'-nucleosyl)-tetraphosphatase (symmetrical) YqeK [Clostridium sediminicola]|uniref:bis(5'-nucleosyl)-tetraphosphatase (symmetrical) YqeK n=1 Tax=Clostridium sediminicola TaxID=3114879 RepID=UPI0031F26F96
MWSEEKIIKYIKANLKKTRFEHCIGVKDTAVKLAKQNGVDVQKALIAALVHDCAKYLSDGKLIEYSKKYGFKLDEVTLKNPSLLHGVAGAYIAKTEMKIEDNEILNAIIYHTTGRKNMSLLEKIIYIADYIEPSRNFPGVDILRKKTFSNLDEGLLLGLDNTINYIIKRGQLLHIDTVNARNDLILKANI